MFSWGGSKSAKGGPNPLADMDGGSKSAVTPVIVRFLKFPERELVFRKAREMESDIDVNVYSDLPKEIGQRRKRQWPRLKKAREEGKIAFFSKPEPDKLFIEGQFVPL